jgi:hypothetical protein
VVHLVKEKGARKEERGGAQAGGLEHHFLRHIRTHRSAVTAREHPRSSQPIPAVPWTSEQQPYILGSESLKRKNHNVNKSGLAEVHNTHILILVFAEVIYSINSFFLEIRKRPEKLDNIDSS